MSVVFLREYFVWTSTLITAVIIAPYICTIERGIFSLRYLIPTLITIAIASIVPVKTTLFFTILFATLFLIENGLGKVNSMAIFLLLLISPIFNYASSALGFPIRLLLSELAASILSYTGSHYKSEGNMITHDGFEFSVDQACAGLNMLAVSLILGLFLITYYQKKLNKRISFQQAVILLSITVLMNILCNLFRIVLLILFKVMPDNILHELIGIICFITYLIIPLVYIVKLFFKHFIKQQHLNPQTTASQLILRYQLVHFALLTAALFISSKLKSGDHVGKLANQVQIQGYKKENLENGIMKFENSQSLIYLKPTIFYAPEHNPMVCWKGSGYDFKSIKKEIISGREIYTGTLIKGNDIIYTAWWFESKQLRTINQLSWRWKALKDNNQFYLININASSPLVLIKTIKEMLLR
ncbi:exosortase N [Pedobacter sp.]|uniref:exosortase N n=1 Tax=Pedobacter sp. TaxID=1411316 RepID=UPI002D094CC0|nr:exosortase N [Pedobacter sp.]HWW41162.1 exosortase N [Pedobacter sp.]